jgi:hypothetical protein
VVHECRVRVLENASTHVDESEWLAWELDEQHTVFVLCLSVDERIMGGHLDATYASLLALATRRCAGRVAALFCDEKPERAVARARDFRLDVNLSPHFYALSRANRILPREADAAVFAAATDVVPLAALIRDALIDCVGLAPLATTTPPPPSQWYTHWAPTVFAVVVLLLSTCILYIVSSKAPPCDRSHDLVGVLDWEKSDITLIRYHTFQRASVKRYVALK